MIWTKGKITYDKDFEILLHQFSDYSWLSFISFLQYKDRQKDVYQGKEPSALMDSGRRSWEGKRYYFGPAHKTRQ